MSVAGLIQCSAQEEIKAISRHEAAAAVHKLYPTTGLAPLSYYVLFRMRWEHHKYVTSRYPPSELNSISEGQEEMANYHFEALHIHSGARSPLPCCLLQMSPKWLIC